jgi:UDP-glucose 4-epimerase
MKILVTGGAGFIGSHLVDKLIARGFDVVVLDNLLRGSKLIENSKLQIFNKDITDLKEVENLTKNCDMIFHLAAFLGVDEVAKNPILTMETEAIGTFNIVNSAIKNNVKTIVYASTSGVYGKTDMEHAVNENFNVSPSSSYAIAKRYNEIYLKSVHLKHNINTFSLRYFNIYGPRQDTRMVIPRFFKQAISNEDILVYGNGQQTRDFTYIDDTIESTINIPLQCKGSEIINITKGEDITILELAKKIKNITNSKSKIQLIDNPSFRKDYEVEKRFGSSEKLLKLIKKKPETNLDRGLELTYRHILNQS